MAVSVRKATGHDAHEVYELVRESPLASAGLPFEARSRMFWPPWGLDEGYAGYVLEDEDRGELVGVIGLLFTERDISNTKHKFCELHTWYVKEEYRHESMKLFMSAVSTRNATMVNYTPTQAVYDLCKKFGFDDLEETLLVFLPIPTWKSLGKGIKVESRKPEIVQQLNEEDKQIFLDHDSIDCRHFLVRRNEATDYSYIILKKMKGREADLLPPKMRWLEPFGRILYVSNRQLFLDSIEHLKMYWCLRLGVKCIVVDHDEVEAAERLPFTKVVPREIPSLYKSKTLKPADIKPQLYSLPLLVGYRMH